MVRTRRGVAAIPGRPRFVRWDDPALAVGLELEGPVGSAGPLGTGWWFKVGSHAWNCDATFHGRRCLVFESAGHRLYPRSRVPLPDRHPPAVDALRFTELLAAYERFEDSGHD